MAQRQPNRLIHSQSPYLLQHAYNPVDWYPWGQEAFERAKRENKLLLISIGYSACHWCHVMEKESFEDEEVARIMNRYFVNVKVDREEHPDVDAYYMQAVQIMTGRGGWPLNVFALPDGRPVFGGTYFPKQQWITLCKTIAEEFQKDPKKFYDYAQQLHNALHQLVDQRLAGIQKPLPSVNEIEKSIAKWKKQWDEVWGGEKRVPKFPLPTQWESLLHWAFLKKDTQAIEHIQKTAERWFLGGIYDWIEGGFCRYSTDQQWHVPHFEKMLYDNALLLQLYAHLWALTKKNIYKAVFKQTTRFLETYFYDKTYHCFYSAMDADSEGEEGKFYVWSYEEIKACLPKDSKHYLLDYFHIRPEGNWEPNKNVLFRTELPEVYAQKHQIPLETFNNWLLAFKSCLLEKRKTRVLPLIDDKAITSWNALCVSAYTYLYRYTSEPHYLEIAESVESFLEEVMTQEDGRMWRTFRKGKVQHSATLEDYAYRMYALMLLYQCTSKNIYLERIRKLLKVVEEDFSAAGSPLFYYSAKEDLPMKQVVLEDDVIPSPNALIAHVHHFLGIVEGNPKYLEQSKAMLMRVAADMQRYPSLFASWLTLYLKLEAPFWELVVVGKDADSEVKSFFKAYTPYLYCFFSNHPQDTIPIFAHRYQKKKTLFYLCRHGVCDIPEESAQAIWEKLRSTLVF